MTRALFAKMEGQHVVVTGGCGFFGAWICAGLLKRGAKVTIVDAMINPVRHFFRDLLKMLHALGMTSYELPPNTLSYLPAGSAVFDHVR